MTKYIYLLTFFFLPSAWSAAEKTILPEKPQEPAYYTHDCHSFGSTTSQQISSDKSDPKQACADANMQAGRSPFHNYKRHTCVNEDGNVVNVFSSLSTIEACGIKNTASMERFAEFLCKDDESPEKCTFEKIQHIKTITNRSRKLRPRMGRRGFF